MNETCPECGLQYLKNQGDPWAFLLFSDRFFFLPIIAAIYFSTLPGNSFWLYAIFGGIALFYIITMPHRYGFCIALDYLTRTRWGDLAEKSTSE